MGAKDIKEHLKSRRVILNLLLAGTCVFLLGSALSEIRMSTTEGVVLNVNIRTPLGAKFMTFYQTDSLGEFTDKLVLEKELDGNSNYQVLKFEMPEEAIISRIRFDLSDNKDIKHMDIRKISLNSADAELELFNSTSGLNYFWMNEFIGYDKKEGFDLIEKNGASDPFMVSENIFKEYKKVMDARP